MEEESWNRSRKRRVPREKKGNLSGMKQIISWSGVRVAQYELLNPKGDKEDICVRQRQ